MAPAVAGDVGAIVGQREYVWREHAPAIRPGSPCGRPWDAAVMAGVAILAWATGVIAGASCHRPNSGQSGSSQPSGSQSLSTDWPQRRQGLASASSATNTSVPGPSTGIVSRYPCASSHCRRHAREASTVVGVCSLIGSSYWGELGWFTRISPWVCPLANRRKFD